MDPISNCQRCNSCNIIRISCEPKEDINFQLLNRSYQSKTIPEDLNNFGKDNILDFRVCLICGQHQGKFLTIRQSVPEDSSDESSGTFEDSSESFEDSLHVELLDENLKLFREREHNFVISQDGIIGVLKDNIIIDLTKDELEIAKDSGISDYFLKDCFFEACPMIIICFISINQMSCQRCFSNNIIQLSIKLKDSIINVRIPSSECQRDSIHLPKGLSFMKHGSYIEQEICGSCGQLQGNFPISPEDLFEISGESSSSEEEQYFATEPITNHKINVVNYNKLEGLYKEVKHGFIIKQPSNNFDLCTIIGVDSNGKIIDVPNDKQQYLRYFNLSIDENAQWLRELYNNR